MLVDHPTWYVVIATGIWGEETTPKGGSDPQGSFPNYLIAINLILERVLIFQLAELVWIQEGFFVAIQAPFSQRNPLTSFGVTNSPSQTCADGCKEETSPIWLPSLRNWRKMLLKVFIFLGSWMWTTSFYLKLSRQVGFIQKRCGFWWLKIDLDWCFGLLKWLAF